MSGDLPRGWAEVELKALVGPAGMFTDGDWILSEHLKSGTDVRLIQLADVGIGQFLDKSRKFISSDTAKMLGVTYLRAGDLLISRMADPLARACIFPQIEKPAITAVDVAIARCDKSVSDPKYLMELCNSHIVHTQAEEVAVGTTRKRISRKNLEQVRVPLPPLAEQKRIAAKVEKLLGKVDASRAQLDKVATILKRFRQSVLAAACSGRLTADWRRGKGKAGEWEPSSVGEVVESLKYGTATKCEYAKRGVPVLRIPNVVSGRIDHSDLKYAKLPAKELQQLRLVAGDVLLIRSNGSVSLVGRTAVVSRAEEDYAYAGYLIRLRPDRKKVQPAFLNLVLSSYDIRLQIEVEARSTSGVNNINSEEVRELSFQLPTLSEQAEIVRRVEELFALADRLDARVAKARGQVDKLTQSILAKAFRGELVPQDPNDEPAEKLLARIRAATGPIATKGGKGASSFSTKRGRPRKVR